MHSRTFFCDIYRCPDLHTCPGHPPAQWMALMTPPTAIRAQDMQETPVRWESLWWCMWVHTGNLFHSQDQLRLMLKTFKNIKSVFNVSLASILTSPTLLWAPFVAPLLCLHSGISWRLTHVSSPTPELLINVTGKKTGTRKNGRIKLCTIYC